MNSILGDVALDQVGGGMMVGSSGPLYGPTTIKTPPTGPQGPVPPGVGGDHLTTMPSAPFSPNGVTFQV